MKSVIFCSARAVDTVFLASVDAFKDHTAAIFRARVGDPMADRMRTVQAFTAAPEGSVLVTDSGLSTGWRAMHGTKITFDPSWPFGPDAPETIQAKGRERFQSSDAPRLSIFPGISFEELKLEQLRAVLRMVKDAMRKRGDGTVDTVGWDITALNLARPFILEVLGEPNPDPTWKAYQRARNVRFSLLAEALGVDSKPSAPDDG